MIQMIDDSKRKAKLILEDGSTIDLFIHELDMQINTEQIEVNTLGAATTFREYIAGPTRRTLQLFAEISYANIKDEELLEKKLDRPKRKIDL
jgi:hypothetical protein